MSSPWEIEDEDAVDAAIDEMFAMVGNEGQESIISRGVGAFSTWGNAALEGGPVDYGNYASTIMSFIGYDAYAGTAQIWSAGYDLLANQSIRHDGKGDTEAGEVFAAYGGELVDIAIDILF